MQDEVAAEQERSELKLQSLEKLSEGKSDMKSKLRQRIEQMRAENPILNRYQCAWEELASLDDDIQALCRACELIEVGRATSLKEQKGSESRRAGEILVELEKLAEEKRDKQIELRQRIKQMRRETSMLSEYHCIRDELASLDDDVQALCRAYGLIEEGRPSQMLEAPGEIKEPGEIEEVMPAWKKCSVLGFKLKDKRGALYINNGERFPYGYQIGVFEIDEPHKFRKGDKVIVVHDRRGTIRSVRKINAEAEKV